MKGYLCIAPLCNIDIVWEMMLLCLLRYFTDPEPLGDAAANISSEHTLLKRFSSQSVIVFSQTMLAIFRGTSVRSDTAAMDITSRCTLGDPNKLPEGVPQPARMPYVSDKHPRQTLEVINLLRKHRELCDVVLVVGAKKIYAHRVILSACSPYFRAMFTGELAESRQTEVVIRDIDERAMELLIDFAYTSQVRLSLQFRQILNTFIDNIFTHFSFLHNESFIFMLISQGMFGAKS